MLIWSLSILWEDIIKNILKKTITIKKDSIYAYNTKLAERDDTRHCDLIVHFIRLVMYLAPERRSAYSYNLNVYTTPS